MTFFYDRPRSVNRRVLGLKYGSTLHYIRRLARRVSSKGRQPNNSRVTNFGGLENETTKPFKLFVRVDRLTWTSMPFSLVLDFVQRRRPLSSMFWVSDTLHPRSPARSPPPPVR